MGQMMFDMVHPAAKCRARQVRRKQLRDALPRTAIPEAAENQARVGPLGQEKSELLAEMRVAVLVYRQMIDIGQRHARFVQTIGDRGCRKSGPVLDTAEALLLDGGDQLAILDKRRRRVAVECVETENNRKWTQTVNAVTQKKFTLAASHRQENVARAANRTIDVFRRNAAPKGTNPCRVAARHVDGKTSSGALE